jgi:hypothetical protein
VPRKDRKPAETGDRDAKGRFTQGNYHGGRPKEYRAFKDRARQFMEAEGLDLLLGMAREPNEFALKLLTEYAYGKPQQTVDMNVQGEQVLYIRGIDPDKL